MSNVAKPSEKGGRMGGLNISWRYTMRVLIMSLGMLLFSGCALVKLPVKAATTAVDVALTGVDIVTDVAGKAVDIATD